MGKVLKPLLIVAAIAVNVIPGVGQAVSGALFGAAFAATATGAAIGLALANTAIALGSSAIKTGGGKGGAPSVTSFDPKTINVDPAARRKGVFGQSAFPLDLRYAEPSGTSQEYIDYVFALAAHKSQGIAEVYVEDKLAWTAASGAQGIYAGYLTIEVITEGGAGAYHTVNAGTTWGASQRMTGCTTMKVRVKRSNNTGTTSPFANGIAGRWTVSGSGMPLYDPALDSTVPGGSGSQRANDCTTWRYTVSSVERGRNPALQLLAYHLGWRIDGVVSVGLGMAPALIDLPSFAVAAARCDEAVTLAAGGSQRRYESGFGFSDDEDPDSVIAALLAAMNGELIDDGGRIGLRVAVNDLTPAMTLTDDDFQGGYSWVPVPGPAEQFTVVRGRFQQAAAPSLFGPADYPDVVIPRTSPAPKPLPLDFRAVQDVRRAERIAKQVAQRSLYQGTFTVTVGVRGWFLRRNMIVAVTSEARAWSAKLFRVRSLRFNVDATVDVVLREENAAVYAWDNDETGNVSPVSPTPYDPRNAPWIAAVAAASLTANWSGVVDDGGKPENGATINDAGDYMNRNGSFEFALRPDGTIPGWSWDDVSYAGDLTVINYAADSTSGTRMAQLQGQVALIGDSFTVRGGEPIWCRTRFGVNAGGPAAEIQVLFRSFDIAGTATDTAIDVDTYAAGAFYTRGVVAFICPAGAVKAQLIFGVDLAGAPGVTGSAVFVDYFQASRTEFGADVTSTAVPSLSVPPLVTINYDFDGTAAGGALPATLRAVRKRGNADVSSTTSWSLTGSGFTASISSDGEIEITATTASSTMTVVSARDGVTLTAPVAINRIVAPPPSSGGTGGTSVSDSTIGSIASNSYGSAIAGTLTVKTGTGGIITLSAPLTITRAATAPAGTFGVYLKWQYRIVGSSYADAAAEVAQATSLVVTDEGGGFYTVEDGSVTCNVTLTGLSASTDYEVELLGRTSSGTTSRGMIGTATAVGS